MDKYGYERQVWTNNLADIARTVLTEPASLGLLPNEDEEEGGPATPSGLFEHISVLPPDWSFNLGLLEVRGSIGVAYTMPFIGLPDVTMELPVQYDIWTGLVRYLIEEKGYVLGESLFEVSYDWRTQLQGRAITSLQEAIEEVRFANPETAEHIVVVSHSMGGQVVMGYAKRQDMAGQPHYINTWITLGAPFQGAPLAFGAMLEMGLPTDIVPLLGHRVGAGIHAILKHASAAHTLLPTNGYTGLVYGGTTCDHPCKHVPAPDWEVSFEDFRDNNLPSGKTRPPWWNLNADVYERADNFHQNFAGDTSIENTTLFVSATQETFDAVLQVKVNDVPDGGGGEVTDVRYVPRYEAVGDGMVPLASALATDQSDAEVLYVQAQHTGVPDHTGVAQVVFDRALGIQTSTLPANVKTSNEFAPKQSLIRAVFNLLFGSIDDGMGGRTELPNFPVTMELLDLDGQNGAEYLLATGDFVDEAGLSTDLATTVATNQGIEMHPAPEQLSYAIPCPLDGQLHHYRLILMPDPGFWYPSESPACSGVPDDQTFDIGGQLLLYDAYDAWSFHEAPGGELLRFRQLWNQEVLPDAIGFSAYVDFTILNGDIQENELRLDVDADADGNSDFGIVGIQENRAPQISAEKRRRIRLSPSPTVGDVRVDWGGYVLDHPMLLKVFDMSGRLVAERRIRQSDSGMTWRPIGVDGRRLSPGAYVLQLIGADGKVMAAEKGILVE